uniref:Uncharacterized protein n=1 Tax=Strongyloides venezuelensis TaxID=75913 RepID=A0A0K0FYW1_STRVS
MDWHRMENKNVFKIRLIDPSEKEKLLAEERQRRRILRMKEAKEQANILSKCNRENQKLLAIEIKQKAQCNKSCQKNINNMHDEKNVCPRLRRYYQFLDKNKEYRNLLNKFTTKFNHKTSLKLKK